VFASVIAKCWIYDGLLLRCAEKESCERIFTFNRGEFRRLAPHMTDRIVAP
jgi:hypothetical protein